MSTFFSLFAFSRKGETDGIFFLLLQKENAWQKKKETGETFRMVPPDPFYRPEPCSGLAAYGSRRIYDRLCRGRCRAQLFATKERYRCGLPLAGTHRPAFCAPILFFLFLRKKRTAAASEEASSIPFPPGRRKLHIRSLLLPSQIVTVSLGHNLAIWNFTTPHAILMMADRRHFADTVCMGTDPGKSILASSDFLIRAGVVKFCRFCYDG